MLDEGVFFLLVFLFLPYENLVNPNCYVAECASVAGALTGYCSTKYFAGDGGPNKADHVGNCPMLPQCMLLL